MADKPEVGATFTIQDAASKTLDSIKSGFGAVSAKADAFKTTLLDIGKTAIGSAIGLNLGSGVGTLTELGKRSLDAAENLKQAEKNAVTLMGSVAKAGTSFDDLKSKAGSFVAELKTIERQSGITGATLQESFASIADKMNPARASITATGKSILYPLTTIEKGLQRSEDQIKQLFTNIGNAGKLVAGGPDALAKSFANFSATGAKASDPIVQLIASTGTLKGNAQQVAAQLRMLTDASALSFAQAAIEKMAAKGKYAPADLQTTVNQLNTVKDQFFTQFGMPISKAVIPVLERFKTTLDQNKDRIEAFAKMMGDKVGKYVTDAGAKIEQGFKYVLDHSKEIGDSIERGAKAAERAFKFIYDNKEAIAVAYGVKAVAPTALAIGKGALPLATGVFNQGIAGVGGMGLEKASHATAAGVGGLVAFTAAAGAFTAAAYQASKLIDENSHRGHFFGNAEKSKDQEAREDYLKNLGHSVGDQDKSGFEKVKAQYVETAKALGDSAEKAAEYADNQWKIYETYNAMAKDSDKAKAFLEAGGGTALQSATAVPTAMDALSNAYANQIAVMYNEAVKSNNVSAAQYAANVIAGSSSVQNALINAKTQLEGGFDSLATILGDKGADIAQKLKGLLDEANGKGVTPTKPVVQFNNNTFNLRQDFRDQDPDRVALVFRQDIVKAAENRRQARSGSAFGL